MVFHLTSVNQKRTKVKSGLPHFFTHLTRKNSLFLLSFPFHFSFRCCCFLFGHFAFAVPLNVGVGVDSIPPYTKITINFNNNNKKDIHKNACSLYYLVRIDLLKGKKYILLRIFLGLLSVLDDSLLFFFSLILFIYLFFHFTFTFWPLLLLWCLLRLRVVAWITVHFIDFLQATVQLLLFLR